jgi:hypothetical protein
LPAHSDYFSQDEKGATAESEAILQRSNVYTRLKTVMHSGERRHLRSKISYLSMAGGKAPGEIFSSTNAVFSLTSVRRGYGAHWCDLLMHQDQKNNASRAFLRAKMCGGF